MAAVLGVGLIAVHLYTVYGAALLDHVLLGAGFDEGALIGDITGKPCDPYSNSKSS